MLARQITLNYRSRTDLTCLSPYSYKLLGALQEVNPHRINNLRTLRQKHPGRGYAFAHQSLLATGFSRPLFSPRYELLFPQPPFFHNDPRCPLVWRPSAPRHPGFSGANERSHSRVWKTKGNTRKGEFRRTASPFNALFRHSMHGNTIQRKVWSHTVNSGRLFFVTEGLRGQSK